MLDSIQDCYYALDRNWTVIEFSRSSEEYFRMARADVIGRNLWDVFPGGRGRPYEALCRLAMDKGERGRMETPSALRPGRTVEMRTAPMPGGISVVITDVTDRRAAEAEARRRADELQTVLDATPAAIWITHDPEGRDISGNKIAQDLLRVRAGDNMSKSAPESESAVQHVRILDADGAELAPEALPVQRAARGEIVEAFEERIVFDDGAEVHLLGNATPLRGAKGEAAGAVAAFIDVTHLKQAEASLLQLTHDLETRVAVAVAEREAALTQLHEAQKTEALGQIAGGVAHDFNNLLMPILGGLDIVRRRGGLPAQSERLLSGAIDSAERARVLVQRMLAFARRQPLQPRAIDVRQLLENLEALLASSVGPRIALNVAIDADTPMAKADANQLELALLNLVLNARDAMPDGGRISIDAGRRGDWVRIAVSDTGVGMDAATLARAVEPFFSTKGVGKGTGLGLSMAHGLAAQLGGALHIASTPRVGTIVELLLKIATPADESGDDADLAPATSARGAVLLVDDEDAPRASTRAMLEELGFTVEEADSARNALHILRGAQAFDWIITDHMMPGMTGADLARAVRQMRPSVKVLIISGFAAVDEIAPDLPRLSKPFGLDALAQQLA